MKNLTGKKRISVSLIISLLTVFFTAMPMLTFGWFKQYMDVTSQTIQITSGESVAYLEIYTYSFINDELTGPLAMHSSIDEDKNSDNIVIETNADGAVGTLTVTFPTMVLETNLLHGFISPGYHDFFNTLAIPEYIIEIRIIKELFEAYLLGTLTVNVNNGTNNYTITGSTEDTNGTTSLSTPFKQRNMFVQNTKSSFVESAVDTYINTFKFNNLSDLPVINTPTNLFSELGTLQEQNAPVDNNITYQQQLYVPSLNSKITSVDSQGNEVTEIAFSKALLFGYKVDPLIILDTLKHTNSGNTNTSMNFELSFEYMFEISNDPFK